MNDARPVFLDPEILLAADKLAGVDPDKPTDDPFAAMRVGREWRKLIRGRGSTDTLN